jgi:hypothetical protein
MFDVRVFAIPKAHANRICVKSCLLCDLEDFNFFDLEKFRTGENNTIVQFGVFHIRVAKGTETAGVCVATIGNGNARCITTKAWCFMLAFNANLLGEIAIFPEFQVSQPDPRFTGVKSPKICPLLSKITVRAFV